MNRTKLCDRKLPDYTRGEEIFNMVSHIVGGALGIVALVLCVVFSAIKGDPWAVVSSAIYGSTLILLYTMSSVYHGLTHVTAKKVL
ncbi:MAG: hemolysin III family protein, partial [Clostridia bacterium]|nr:hemolysin III family protein [Clostridia bacterium]